jgi:NTP pyrophosphatase (non-canonical NTP hydrolase)
MSDTPKIETKATSVRLPLDVIGVLERWAEETGQSVAGCITTCVRVAAEDEKRITKLGEHRVLADESVLQGADVIQNVIQIRMPASRDELADVITQIMFAARVGDRDMVSALGVARARVYKTTAEYQAAEELRQKNGVEGVYSDERRLASQLSATDPVDRPRLVGAREKGDSSR